ncbi:hypothetical protein EYV94_02170 [Puteibacter caeruleilacunae]|nr:hypothetical protein EYV94_02170 [Puteibacter caeruleilacunae]
MRKPVFILICVQLISCVVLGQVKDTTRVMDYSTEVSIGFSSDLEGGSSWYRYIAPQLSFPVMDKMTLDLSGILSSESFNDFKIYDWQGGGYPGLSTNRQSFGLDFQTTYQLTEKTALVGFAWYDREIGDWNEDMYDLPSLNSVGVSLYLDHKFSEKFSIGVGVGVHRNSHPFCDTFLPHSSQRYLRRF